MTRENDAEAHAVLDRESPVPLYLQIRQQLLAMISDWPDPQRKFPTDEELARHFDVTKATVRQALAEFTQSGLLRRRRGVGTYVVPPLVEQLRPNLDIEDQYKLAGASMTHRVQTLDTRAATAAEARVLGIAEGAQVLFLRRVRSIAHVPVAIDDRVMTVEMADRLNLTKQTATGSIIDMVRRHLTLSRASWELNARLAGQRDAMLLQIAATDPILVRALVYYASDDTPILTGETRHRSDMIRCGFEMALSDSPACTDVRSWTSDTLLATAPSDTPGMA